MSIGKIWLEEPYILYPAEVLKEKYYPFTDRFGQLMTKEWPDKIYEESDFDRTRRERKILTLKPSRTSRLERIWRLGKRSVVECHRKIQG